MSHVIAGLLIVVGLLNLAPVLGVLSVARLEQLYGLTIDHGDLGILMRHRALLFGLLGAFIIASAFQQVLRPTAIVGGFVSMLGFIVIALPGRPYGAAIHKLVLADAFGSVLLLVAAVLLAATSGD